ncbi:hypothetical protein Vadar_031981 [Vaccinium darrowii]|uniref:Uncharacterized protein n=1 Tax=Vaccinium darrowii TaxID=229202 RepID=A0ACB7X5R0_9ERIC|nr:hypothetical protein Vadar_031981 [Vaccinium darrowii]
MAINTTTPPFILSLLTTAAHHASLAPAVDCSIVIRNLVDCLSYVTDGSTTTKTKGKMLFWAQNGVEIQPECLCEAFKNNAQLGITLNVTKALDLPSACHVSVSSINKG